MLLVRAFTSSPLFLYTRRAPRSSLSFPTRRSSDLEIRTYRIIYEAVEEVKAAMAGLLAPEKKEVVLGEAEVRQLFKIAKVGTIAGSFVRSGVIPRTARVRVVRDGVEVYDGTLASLKRFKDDVR